MPRAVICRVQIAVLEPVAVTLYRGRRGRLRRGPSMVESGCRGVSSIFRKIARDTRRWQVNA